MADLHIWLTAQVAKLPRGHDPTKACLDMLNRWDAFTRLLADGRICRKNSAAERALRCIPLGSRRGCSAAPTAAGSAPPSSARSSRPPSSTTSIRQAWLADVLACIADHPATRVNELLPWNSAQCFRVGLDVNEELAEEMTLEPGCLSVIDSTDENARAVTAFTHRGLEYLEDLLDDRRAEFLKEL